MDHSSAFSSATSADGAIGGAETKRKPLPEKNKKDEQQSTGKCWPLIHQRYIRKNFHAWALNRNLQPVIAGLENEEKNLPPRAQERGHCR